MFVGWVSTAGWTKLSLTDFSVIIPSRSIANVIPFVRVVFSVCAGGICFV